MSAAASYSTSCRAVVSSRATSYLTSCRAYQCRAVPRWLAARDEAWRAGIDGRRSICPPRTGRSSTRCSPTPSWLRRRTDDAKPEVLAITGELADLAETAVEQAKRVLVNARRAGDQPVKKLMFILGDLAHVIDGVEQVIVQTRQRLDGETPPGKTRCVSLHDDDARPIRKGSLATPTQFGYTGQVTDTRDGFIVDYEIEAGMPPDAPRLAPAIARAIAATAMTPDAVTADRGYGEAAVDTELAKLGVTTVAILRKGKPGKARQHDEAEPGFVELVKWRTGAEGRIAALKRQHGWGRSRIRGLEGTRIWCG